MPKLLLATSFVIAALLPSVGVPLAAARPPQPQAPAPVQPARFEGTWVGTQAWAIDNPPPGASQDQPVTVELRVVEGKLVGVVKPFLGGEEGATIEEARIVGEELHLTATVGRPRPQAAGRRGSFGWKDAIRVAFVFTNNGVKMTGTADVRLGDVPWMKFKYDLGKKRSRY